MKTFLSAMAILDAEDLLVEEVEVPEWPDPETGQPGIVRLKQMSAERSAAFTNAVNEHGEDGMYIILAFCATDADDNLIFTLEDVAKLRKKSLRVLNALQSVCLRINKMQKTDEAVRKNA